MPYYMYQASLTDQSWKALLAKPQDRAEAAAHIVEAHGGKLHSYFFAFGKIDVVVIVEYPNNNAAMAAALAIAGSGSVTGLKTTPLVPSSEAVGAMREAAAKADAYQPPSAT